MRKTAQSTTTCLVLFLVLSFSFGAAPTTDTRGIKLTLKDQGTALKPVNLYDRMIAVIIGIDQYENLPAKDQLKYAVNDAKGVAQVLEDRYPVDKVHTLFNEQATRANIMRVLQGTLANAGPEDAVLVYFAGHGISRSTQQGELGYLIPFDGSLKADEMYKNISMQQLRSDVSPLIPAKHVLFVMDACFGGLLLDKRAAGIEPARKRAYLEEITREPVRQIITAGAKGQEVLDGGIGGHSVFTGRLIEDLKNNNDFLTGKELGLELQRQVFGDAQARGHSQRPQFGEIYGTGDFVFVPDFAKLQKKTSDEVEALEAEVARLSSLKAAALKRRNEAEARMLEREQLLKEAQLKQASIRQTAAKREAEEHSRLEAELRRDSQEQARQEEERKKRLAYLKTQSQKMLEEMGGSVAAALGIKDAQKEVERINGFIVKLEADYETETERQVAALSAYYGPRIAKAGKVTPYDQMFETRAEYDSRKARAESEVQALERERAQKENSIRAQLKSDFRAQVAPLEKQRKEITDQEFPVGPKQISFKLEKYNPETQTFTLTANIDGIDSRGTVSISKSRARQYYENPALLVPSATLQVAGGGLVILQALTFHGPQDDTYRAEAERILKDDYLGTEFVYVPGGCYEMGCGQCTSNCEDDEEPAHRVCVDSFFMARTEVTQGEWQKVMGTNPSEFTRCGSNCPVEQVSWDDAQTFIVRLNLLSGNGYRLPTEAEWEYACRSGGRCEEYSGGASVDKVAWTKENSGEKTHPVGQKAPNGLGLYDMNGNVFEWVEDMYGKTAYGQHAVSNPTYNGGGAIRVNRGGSWSYGAASARCGYRSNSSPGNRRGNLGLRLVRTR